MAEIELSVFSRQVLRGRMSDEMQLRRKIEIEVLETQRNEAAATIHWRFSTFDARHKLQYIYPYICPSNSA